MQPPCPTLHEVEPSKECIILAYRKLTGMAFRVPVPDVSVVDLTVKLKTNVSNMCKFRECEEQTGKSMWSVVGTISEYVVLWVWGH